MTNGSEVALPSRLLSGTIKTYARHFMKLFLLFLVFISILAIPLFVFLPSYVQAILTSIEEVDALASYMLVYMLTSLVSPLVQMIAMTFAIGVVTAPFAMGLAGKIISDDSEGVHATMKEQMQWTVKNYKRLISAYALHYVVVGLFAYICFALLTGIMSSSHIVIERWFTPMVIILPILGMLLLIGLVFLPFGVIEEKKSGLGALAHSFRMMYAGGIVKNFFTLLIGVLIAGAVLAASQIPYIMGMLSGQEGHVLETFMSSATVLVRDEVYIFVSVAVTALVGVFLYIIAYNTYRGAKSNYAGKHGGIK